MAIEKAITELRTNAGRQFDPDLIAPFLTGLESMAGSTKPARVPSGALVALAS